MALRIAAYCYNCKRSFVDVVSSDHAGRHLCPECKKLEEDANYKVYFDKLDSLTIEERLRKVEEWIYNYKPHSNVRF